jgi:K+-transporting ATPase KdpF subunit
MNWAMSLDYSVALLVSIGMLVYLILALLKPERF